MTRSRIRVMPFESPTPRMARLPLENARRWISIYESEEICAPISIFFTRNAYIQAVAHADSDLDVEVGGVLVGRWYVDSEAGRQYVVITTSLPARFTQQGSVFLTFTQASLVDIHAKIDEEYPEDSIVGWYHTHPHMGVFLSQHDTWLHDHFFPEPWQMALVIEPHSQIGGFFVRQAGGLLDPARYFGFYELGDNTCDSIVNWDNLIPGSATIENKGVNQNE
jgi:proteasome lid subunit RPN8/RPN11